MKFTKGQSGNPAGRRRGASLVLTRELKKALKSGKAAREFAQKLVALALEGNVQAAKLVFERVDGKVRSSEELAAAEGAAVAPSDPQARRRRILDLLRQPELRELIDELRSEQDALRGNGGPVN